MVGKWISSMSFNADRRELIVVDFRAAYVVDVSSSTGSGSRLVRRVVGPKSGGLDRLTEPFGVTAACGGGGDSRLVFTDRADQAVKIYSGRGHHIRSVDRLGLANVSGVGVNPYDAFEEDIDNLMYFSKQHMPRRAHWPGLFPPEG